LVISVFSDGRKLEVRLSNSATNPTEPN